MAQKRINDDGETEVLSPEELMIMRQKLERSAVSDRSRYAEIAGWLLGPAEQRWLRRAVD
jgi:hypothetical protein